jgi:hypothetical protein
LIERALHNESRPKGEPRAQRGFEEDKGGSCSSDDQRCGNKGNQSTAHGVQPNDPLHRRETSKRSAAG